MFANRYEANVGCIKKTNSLHIGKVCVEFVCNGTFRVHGDNCLTWEARVFFAFRAPLDKAHGNLCSKILHAVLCCMELGNRRMLIKILQYG
jgi:hypothetical protein